MVLTGVELDLFIPSFPQLQEYFSLSPFMVELTLSLNLFFHCVTALIVGNLGDKFGRKPVLIYGLVIFVIGSILCVVAPYYWVLLLGRSLQGIGISGPSVLVYVLMADMYSTEKIQKLLGVLHGTITIAMAAAPVVGSYINLFFNWRGNFIALLILGVITLICAILYTPDSKIKSNIDLSLKAYMVIFRSRKALLYLVFLCFAMQSYWVFIGMSPILYMNDFKVSLKDFGLYQGAIAAVFAVSSLTSPFFLKRFSHYNCFLYSLVIMGLFTVAVIMLLLLKVNSPLLITLTMLLQAAGISYSINLLWPLAIDAVCGAKGRMGALLVSGRLIVTAFIISIVSYFYNGTFFSTGLAIVLTLLISALACYFLFRDFTPLARKDSIL